MSKKFENLRRRKVWLQMLRRQIFGRDKELPLKMLEFCRKELREVKALAENRTK